MKRTDRLHRTSASCSLCLRYPWDCIFSDAGARMGLAGCDVSFPYYELLSLATTRCGRLLHECLPLVLGDESGLQKSRRYIFESVDVFAVIFPWAIARAKLVEAASVRVHNRAERRVRAKIAIIGHAIVIAVHGENLAANCR